MSALLESLRPALAKVTSLLGSTFTLRRPHTLRQGGTLKGRPVTQLELVTGESAGATSLTLQAVGGGSVVGKVPESLDLTDQGATVHTTTAESEASGGTITVSVPPLPAPLTAGEVFQVEDAADHAYTAARPSRTDEQQGLATDTSATYYAIAVTGGPMPRKGDLHAATGRQVVAVEDVGNPGTPLLYRIEVGE